jgi:ADP-dependent glucokinase
MLSPPPAVCLTCVQTNTGHVHTLAYQAIMTTKGSPWKNTMSATAKASLTAHRHVCGSNYIHTEKSKLLMDESFASSISSSSTRISLHENRPVSCWDEDDYEICVAPVYEYNLIHRHDDELLVKL